MKKLLLAVMCSLVFVSFTTVDYVDAKPRMSYKSPRKSFTPTAPRTNSTSTTNKDSISKSTTSQKSGTTSTTGTNRGFLSGGGLMRGMMIGGFAGLLFGGMFSQMGGFGSLLGLLVNVFIIIMLVRLATSIYRSFKNRPKPNNKRY